MKVRYPVMDFSQVRAHWTPCPEFAQSFNAFSTVPAHIEPYLVKVMTKAKKIIPAENEQLIHDVEIFNKQEVQHCKQHLAFNNRLYELGYEGMKDIEQGYKDDYERFLTTKSMRFNIAYCEGFEALGSASAQIYFEDMVDYLEGADAEVLNLWKWHLAEEFEHRSVCADVYKTLYGSGPYAYAYRVSVFMFALKHIGDHVQRVNDYLNAKDRESMGKEELADSVKREKALVRRVKKASRERLAMVMSPTYDPAKRKAPPGLTEALALYPDTRS